MNVIMFGPSYGHNAKVFIDLFQENSDCNYYYVSKGTSKWKDQGNLKVLSYENKFTPLIKDLLKNKKALIWIHGGYDIRQLYSIFKNKHDESFVNLNIWGDQVPQLSLKNNLKGWCYRYFFKKADALHCNWYGTYSILEGQYDNLTVKPWGLSQSFFESSSSDLNEFTENFIITLPSNKYKFFYPKSILPVSGQIEVIEACKKLVESSVNNFIVYLWVGNTNDTIMKNKCENLIKKYKLSETVKIIEHPFLPFGDIKKIWSCMDCGLQIAKSDQLSTTFLEPQLVKKNIIATSILPYKAYNEMYGTKLELVNIDVKEIYINMKKYILGELQIDEEELSKRKSVVEDNFNFNKNILDYINEIKMNNQ